MVKKIIFIGKPGSGKGTQAEQLSKEIGVEHISISDIVRMVLHTETHPLREQVIQYVESTKWKPLPDDLAIKLTHLALEGKDSWILDGFPRNINQAIEIDIEPDNVFYLNISNEESLHRLTLRKREDDVSINVNERLLAEKERLPELVDYYRNKGLLYEVNGCQSVTEIFNEIQGFMKQPNEVNSEMRKNYEGLKIKNK